MKQELLRMEHIESYKGSKQVLRYAKINLFTDETIGIAGLNYSGKSTLAGAIAGFHPHEKGTIYYCEKETRFSSIHQSRKAGIYYIQEKSSLIPQFSIADNLFLTPQKKEVILHREQYRKKTNDILSLLGIKEQADTTAKYLSAKYKLLTEIGIAVLNEAKIIILDNVLNKLPESSLEELKGTFQMLNSLHISIILIETGLKYLKPYSGRIFIMRNGMTVAELDQQEFEDPISVSLLTGEPFHQEFVPADVITYFNKKPLLSFHNIRYKNILHKMSFEIFEGETAGILNVNKSSGNAIAALLSGTASRDEGQIFLNGIPTDYRFAEDSIVSGVAVLQEKEHIFRNFSIEENITLTALKKQKKTFARMNGSELKYISGELFHQYIKPQNHKLYIGDPVPNNRLIEKKVAFCRALASQPKLLVYCNPTQKMDVFSKKAVYDDITSLKLKKITTVVISSDVWELLQVCERIIIINEGIVDRQVPVTKENKNWLIHKFGDQIKNI